MRYNRFDPPRTQADFDRVYQHQQTLGWERIPEADEQAIAAAWERNCECNKRIRLPSPSCTWDTWGIRRLGEQANGVESEVTLKLLNAFRRCVHPSERLIVIDWMHGLYYFDPSGGVMEATLDEWAYPILPDGWEPHFFVASDFRFGVGTDTGRRLTIFGEDLLNTIAHDPPRQFLRLCKCINDTNRKRWQRFQSRAEGTTRGDWQSAPSAP